jgi:hypothetical protein
MKRPLSIPQFGSTLIPGNLHKLLEAMPFDEKVCPILEAHLTSSLGEPPCVVKLDEAGHFPVLALIYLLYAEHFRLTELDSEENFVHGRVLPFDTAARRQVREFFTPQFLGKNDGKHPLIDWFSLNLDKNAVAQIVRVRGDA